MISVNQADAKVSVVITFSNGFTV